MQEATGSISQSRDQWRYNEDKPLIEPKKSSRFPDGNHLTDVRLLYKFGRGAWTVLF